MCHDISCCVLVCTKLLLFIKSGKNPLLFYKIFVNQAYGQPYGECAHGQHRNKHEQDICQFDPHRIGIDYELPVATQADNAELLLELLLTDLLIQLCRHARKQHRKNSRETVVPYIQRLIEERFSSPVSLDKICAELGMKKSRVCLLFREACGNTVMEALYARRIEEAKKQLANTDHSILQICSRCGFGDVSAFYRRFQKAVGISPLKYRRKWQRINQ